MEYKKVVSDTIEESEKKQQEKEIEKIKEIVRSYLNKINDKEEDKKKLEKEIRILKDDLDDLKMGRLDKIEERQTKDPEHNKTTLIIIKKIEKEYIPYQPWFSPWYVEMKPYTPYYYDNMTYIYGNSDAITLTGTAYCSAVNAITTAGTSFQNFSQGSYTLNSGKIINL
jgi:hypothetical protein